MSILAKQRAREPRPRLHPRPDRPAARRPARRRPQGRQGHQQRRRRQPARGGGAGRSSWPRSSGCPALRVAVVTGDDIEADIDRPDGEGVSFTNLDTGAELVTVRERLTHAAVYTGCEGIVEALRLGADVVICGRVTDIALYLGPLIHEFGWATDDWQRLGMATVVAHAIECGGQATGGLYAGGLAGRRRARGPRLPDRRGARGRHRRAHQDPGHRRAGGHRHGQRAAGLRDPRPGQLPDRRRDRRLHPGAAGGGRARPGAHHRWHREAPAGHAQGQHGLPRRLRRRDPVHLQLAGRLGEVAARDRVPQATGSRRADFEYSDDIVEYVGHTRCARSRIAAADDPDLPEIVVRYAARCPDAENARKVFTESVPLYNNGPAGVAGVGTRPPLKELYAIWSCLIPREHVIQSVETAGGLRHARGRHRPRALRRQGRHLQRRPGGLRRRRLPDPAAARSPTSGSPSTTATW